MTTTVTPPPTPAQQGLQAGLPAATLLSPAELDQIRHAAVTWSNAGFVPGLLSHIDALQGQLFTIQAAAESGMPELKRLSTYVRYSGNGYTEESETIADVKPDPRDGDLTPYHPAIAHLRNARQASVLSMGLVTELTAQLAAAKVESTRLRRALEQIRVSGHHEAGVQCAIMARVALEGGAQPSTLSPATTSPSP